VRWGTRRTSLSLSGAVHAWTRIAGVWHSLCGLVTTERIVQPRKELRGRESLFGCTLCARKARQ